MVPLLLTTAVFEMLTALLAILPEGELSLPDVEVMGVTAGTYVAPFNALLPVSETVAVLVLTVTVIAPAVLLYRLILFVWGKIPVIGGS